MNEQARMVELQRLLAQALDLADGLDLTMVAIHIDEARNLMHAADTTVPR